MSFGRMIRGVVRSARPANLPTLLTNAAVAWGMCNGGDWGLYGWAVLAGTCFYLYGMWGNDRADARWDSAHDSSRPVPRGDVSVGVLQVLCMVVLCGGVFLGHRYGGVEGTLTACVLGGVIMAYNVVHKHWRWAFLLMGGCRALWVILAGYISCVSGEGLPSLLWWYAGGLWAYTCLITVIARHESGNPHVQCIVCRLLSGMCLFDALWLFCSSGLPILGCGAVLAWVVCWCMQKAGARAT